MVLSHDMDAKLIDSVTISGPEKKMYEPYTTLVSPTPFHMCSQRYDRLCGLAVRYSLGDREVRGSIPGRVKPRTLKLVLAVDLPSVCHYGFCAKSGRPGVRIMWLGVVYAIAPYITAWPHAFNCPKRRL
ncbi:hypothetical protein ElyMa_003655800 [Elysia marginata]|uniref:Uncharacterized protein n=1 Tax=Elysia marginata TaxID=1093978 RepID=A0AAV4EYY2_9GAST|nr:hypothetical protein ElyMa_003655800 [Elysia marginata]